VAGNGRPGKPQPRARVLIVPRFLGRHPPNQVALSRASRRRTQNGTCAESSRDELRSRGLPSRPRERGAGPEGGRAATDPT
jgi:hypothetical protein